ncbi:hypothetical protein VNI00_013392 [Paramarasmius palmivorus]|uniref:MYND-type domain-containing protein n=1 Tax=Paramarasmius palmivorus TaxID=297713 RepID=A0AAW0C2G1_9AGAR
MAATSDPKTLKHVRDMLDIPVPSDKDPQCVVGSRCIQAVKALEVYAVYLLPCYYGHHRQVTVFPGMNEAETWVIMWKWFLVLEGWSPSFGGISTAPLVMQTATWYNRVIHSIFDLAFVLVHHHAKSPLTKLLSQSKSFLRFCVRVLFGALTVDDTVLCPVVSVLVHSFWSTEVYDTASLPQLIRSIVEDTPAVDFALVALKRFSRLTTGRNILSRTLELHAVGVALVQLYPLNKGKLLMSDAPRWFARCVSSLMRALRCETAEGKTVSSQLDTESIAKLSILCFRFLRIVAARGGSSGWILDALNQGLFEAISSIRFFLEVEVRRSKLSPVWTHRQDMIEECDALLNSFTPHLLTPSVLRVIRCGVRCSFHRDFAVLPSWKKWLQVVSVVFGVHSAYKKSTYRYDSVRRCANPECPRRIMMAPLSDEKLYDLKEELAAVREEHTERGVCTDSRDDVAAPPKAVSAEEKETGVNRTRGAAFYPSKEDPVAGDIVEVCDGENCGEEDDDLSDDESEDGRCMKCYGCVQTSYCTRYCQKVDWKRHRLKCKDIQQQRGVGLHKNLYCDKGFIRYYVQYLLARREPQLAKLRSSIPEKHFIVFNFGSVLDVLCIMPSEELPRGVLQLRPQTPKGCVDEDLVVVLCEKQSLVLWMWHGPLRLADDLCAPYEVDSDE